MDRIPHPDPIQPRIRTNKVDQAALHSLLLHTITKKSEAQLKQFLKQAGFKNSQIKSKLYKSPHDSVLTLMQDLKHLGAHHVIEGRNKKITTKTSMQQMIAAYAKYRVSDQIPATFEVIIVAARV